MALKRGRVRWLAALATIALLIAACTQPGPAATVDGVDVESGRIESLHPGDADLDGEQRAATLFLIILHELITREAEAQFDAVASSSEIDAAMVARLGDVEDVADQRLADRGITRDRVLLEAELDVLRAKLQRAFIEEGGPGVDLDTAFRTFLGVNSRACVQLLAPVSPDVVADIESVVQGDISLEAATAQLADLVEPVDLGCDSPANLPPPVQPLALDGEVGRAYLSTFSDGTVYVAAVTERDAPALDEVIEEVESLAAESQGSTLFDEWAFEILKAAEVFIDSDIGTWEPRDGTGDVPTVVPPD